MKEQWEAAMKLLGKKIRFRHMPPGSGAVCISVSFDGMVGLNTLSGEFAPHLFLVDEGADPAICSQPISQIGTVN